MNYQQDTKSVTKWKRAKHIDITNELEQAPNIRFWEEVVIDVEGTKITSDAGILTKNVTDFTESYPLLNPETMEPTGSSISIAEAYAVVYSLYIYEANARDARENNDEDNQ